MPVLSRPKSDLLMKSEIWFRQLTIISTLEGSNRRSLGSKTPGHDAVEFRILKGCQQKSCRLEPVAPNDGGPALNVTNLPTCGFSPGGVIMVTR